MFLLILDSLGNSELIFILVMALIFFGPRKLPQISRSLGKSLAEFRKASEDFKRTWEREVAMETPPPGETPSESETLNNQLMGNAQPQDLSGQSPTLEAIPAQSVVPRQAKTATGETISPVPQSEQAMVSETGANSEPSRKRDWL